MTRYFWSDPHFFHANILRYCDRPFKDINEQESVLIKNYNSVVKPEDVCYWLGDAGFFRQPDQLGRILGRLNGTKILILGNHDEFPAFTYVNQGFISVHTSLVLHDLGWVLNHDPAVHCCMSPDMKLIHGHIHTLFKHVKSTPGVDCVNVGVDMWNFTPVSEAQIQELFKGENHVETWDGKDPHKSEDWKRKERKRS